MDQTCEANYQSNNERLWISEIQTLLHFNANMVALGLIMSSFPYSNFSEGMIFLFLFHFCLVFLGGGSGEGGLIVVFNWCVLIPYLIFYEANKAILNPAGFKMTYSCLAFYN